MSKDELKAHFADGLGHHRAGRLAEAERIYREILQANPQWPPALHYLGVAAWQTGRREMAFTLIEQAAKLAPNDAELLANLGEMYRSAGQAEPAATALRRSLALDPNQPGANNNFGSVLANSGREAEAIPFFARAAELQPDAFLPHFNLANSLFRQKRVAESLAAYERARALRPDDPELLANLGCALRTARRLDEAIAVLTTALQRDPQNANAHRELGCARFEQGRVEEAVLHLQRVVELRPDDAGDHSRVVFTVNSHPDFGPAEIAALQANWRKRHADALAQPSKHPNDPDPNRRLRLGYVSPDFFGHALGFNLLPVLAHHDPAVVEVYCYADVRTRDVVTEKFQQQAQTWRETQGCSDAELAAIIRSDRIDVLVDLTLHASNNRLLVFARKPAPLQVTFAGYPGSTGLTTIDYRLTDPKLDPPGMFEAFCSESTVRLPHSFWCFHPFDQNQVNALPALGNGYVTFGCLSTFNKVNARVLALWAGVLKQVPGSRLLLLAPEGQTREDTRGVFAANGVDGARIDFVSRCARMDYFKYYHRIDIGLDTVPYNGHTTSLDSLWMGVPVVTLVGWTIVGRAGWSQLSNLGLQELAAHDATEFATVAGRLAADLPRLAGLRATLRARMEASPLMDAPQFTRDLEAAYRTLWHRWCERSRD